MDRKKLHASKLRDLGILKEKKDMPPAGKVKASEEGYAPRGSRYSEWLYNRYYEEPTEGKDIEKAISKMVRKNNNPETQEAAEDLADTTIDKVIKDPESKKRYKDYLKMRMRTA